MTPPRVLRLQEAAQHRITGLSHEQALWLGGSGVGTVSPAPHGAWDVEVSNVAGVVSRGDLVVSIEPKVPVAAVLWMLQEAHGLPAWDEDEAPWAEDIDLVDAVIDLYLRSVARLLDKVGLRRAYRTVHETAWTLRGRLRSADQLTRHYGRMLPIEVTYDDFSLDTPQNRILAAALDLVRDAGSSPRSSLLAARAEALLAWFEGVVLQPRGVVPELTNSDRLPDGYKWSLKLASLILEGASVTPVAGGRRALSLLIPMPQVFERCVAQVLRTTLGSRLIAQSTRAYAFEDARATASVRPDLVILDAGGRPVTVLDTKYKRAEPSPADLYQMHVYARMYGVRDVVLLYAERSAPRVLDLETETRVRLHLRGVDLSLHSDEVRHHIVAASHIR